MLDNQDFQNKDIKIAIWKKGGVLYFYALCDGVDSLKTFDFSQYKDNKINNGFWKYVETKAKLVLAN